jgi:hypothetical protein
MNTAGNTLDPSQMKQALGGAENSFGPSQMQAVIG